MIKIKLEDFLDKISEEVINNNKKITLFIGAGFSVWYGYPPWNSLFYDFCSKILSEEPDKKKYLDDMTRKVEDGYHIPIAFDEVINELGLDENYLREFLLLYFREIDRTNRQNKFSFPGLDLAKYELLFKLSKYCKIITTNFDTLIEDIIKEKFNIDLQVLYYDFEKLKSGFFSKDNNNYSILKLHGDINRKETLILSEKDYRKIRIDKEYRLVRQALKDNFASEINIFIGYSLSDENIKELLIDNQDVYGNDKETSYIINLYKLIDMFLKEQRLIENNKSYDALGVDEIYISCFDELFTILRFITNLYEIKQNLNEEVSRNYSFQIISKNHNIWEQTCFAINLFNSHLNQAARNVLENIIEKYDGEEETNWAFIYGLMGAILTSSKDEQRKLEGNGFISKAISISNDKDSIYFEIGNFYLVNSVKERYTTNISDNLGIIVYTDKESVEKALYYFNSIENKNDIVRYKIFLCECRNGNENEALEIGYKLLEGNSHEESLHMEMGFIYYRLAMRITDEASEEKNKYLIECTKFLEEYINTDSFIIDKPNNKKIALERCIRCLNQIGEHDKAKTYCDKLIKLEPTSSELHMSLILIYIYQNEFDKAIAECDYLINHTKSIGKLKEIVTYIKAQCIFANAKYTHEVLEAINLCKKVLEKGKFADVAYTISCMYQHIGRLYKMREYIVKSCYIYPLNDKLFDYAITLLGSSFPSEGDYFDFKDSVTKMEALRKHRKVFEENIIDDECKYYLYKHLNLKPKYPLKKIMIIDNISFKEFIFGKIKANIPDDVKVDIEEAFNCYNKKEYKIVMETLSKYKDNFDSNHIFKYVYANSLSNLKNANNAIPIYEEIIKDYMNCYDNTRQKLIYFYFGDCFFEISDYSKAYEYYVKALELDGEFPNAIFKIAHSLFNLSKVSDYEYDINLINQSKYYFEKYTEYEEYDWEAYINLEYIYSILGEFEKLIEIAKRWINYSLPYDILLEFYNYLIQGNLMIENDIDAKTYIDSAEGMISNNISEFRNKHNLYQFFNYKGIYYANYSYETSVKSFKRAYEFSPTDENKICFENNIEPGRTFYLENDFKTIIRGGERYKPEQKN